MAAAPKWSVLLLLPLLVRSYPTIANDTQVPQVYNLTANLDIPQGMKSPIAIRLLINLPEGYTIANVTSNLGSYDGSPTFSLPQHTSEPKVEYEYIRVGFTESSIETLESLDSETWTISDISEDYMVIRKTIESRGSWAAPAAATPRVCDLTTSNIDETVATLKKFLRGESTIRFSDQMEASDSDDECQQALLQIRYNTNRLMDLYKNFQETEQTDVEEYEKMNNNYRVQMKELMHKIKYIRKLAGHKVRDLLSELETVRQHLEGLFMDVHQKLWGHISTRQDDLAQLIGSEINKGHLKLAVQKYQSNLIDKNQVSDIIKKAYRTSSIDRILAFINWLPFDSNVYRAKAIKWLVQMIEEQNDFSNPKIILVDRYVKVLISKFVSLENDQMLKELSKKLDAAVRNILQNWGEKVISGENDEIVEFANQSDKIMVAYMKQLTNSAWDYGRQNLSAEETAQKILDFADKLQSLHSQIVWTELYRLMQVKIEDKYDNFALVPAMRIAINEYQTNGDESELAQQFPRHWMPMIKGEPVCLWNLETDTMLYVREHFNLMRDSVYTASNLVAHHQSAPEPKTNFATPKVISTKWRMVTPNKAQSWLIKSDGQNHHLYAAYDGFALSQEKRRLFTWRTATPQPEGYWQLSQDGSWQDNRFFIYNTYRKEYLGVDEKENARPTSEIIRQRNVFTWRGSGKGPNSQWKIVSC